MILVLGSLAVLAWSTSKEANPFESFFWMCFAALAFAFPAWLIALPLILAVSRVDGWRFWVLLCTGTLIGPAALFALEVVGWLIDGGSGRMNHPGWSYFGFGGAVALITSLVYLLLLRRAQRRDLSSGAG